MEVALLSPCNGESDGKEHGQMTWKSGNIGN